VHSTGVEEVEAQLYPAGSSHMRRRLPLRMFQRCKQFEKFHRMKNLRKRVRGMLGRETYLLGR